MAEWLITLQIQISLAVVAILILRQAMKKMPKVYSYLLWLLVFTRLLVPVSVESRFSFMPSEQEQEALVEQVLESVVRVEDSELSDVDAYVPENLPGNSDQSGNITGNQLSEQPDLDKNHQMNHGEILDIQPDNAGTVDGLQDDLLGSQQQAGANELIGADAENQFLAWSFVVLWALGSVAVLGYNGIVLWKVRRKLSSVRYLLDRIEVGAGSAPVYECEGIHTPFTLGFFTPAIYLPTGLTADEQEYILCHERVHISRKDNLVKNLAFLLTAVYWFNPFVWVAFFFMERDMEMSCDEKVIKLMGKDIKKNYSQSLLDFAARPKEMPATHLTFGENSVKQRVKNVLSYKNAKKWSLCIGVVVLVIVVVALFTTGRDESVQVDGQGSSVQEESEKDNPDHVYTIPGLALSDWINNFKAQNDKVVDNTRDFEEGDDTATIRYLVADGWERYILQETVNVLQEGDTYRIERDDLVDFSTIETNEEFEALYGTPGRRDLNLLRYSASYYRSILQQFHSGSADAEYCARFVDPVTAAVEMLNLGEGSGVAKLEDGSFVSDGGTLGGIILDGSGAIGRTANGGSDTSHRTVGNISNGLHQDAYFQEGTYAYVTYTFAKDGSQVEIPMRLIEGSYGIWSVDPDAVREITQEPEHWVIGSIRDRLGFTLEFSEYGIYRNTDGVLENICPYYISSDFAWDEENGILYFAADSSFEEGATSYYEDVVCMLDLTTGEMDLETLSLEGMPVRNGSIMGVNVGSGYVSVTRGNTYLDNSTYYMPLINTGNTTLATGYTYNGKAVKDLSAVERDAYSVALRNEILKKGEVVKISNRTMDETYAYVDLDGDGKAEKIVLSQDTEAEEENWGIIDFKYDCFKLQVGDSIVTGYKEHLENELRFFSPDGENIVIALYGDGPSDDYTTMMYLYKDGELRKVGEIQSAWTDIVLDQAKGIFYVEDSYHYFVQPVWLLKAWKINESGQVEEIPQETYEIIYGRTILPDLLVALPVHETPGGEEVTYIQPQKVDFIRFNSTFDWVYIEAADGTSGWFEIDVQVDSGVTVRIVDLNLNHWEVFTLYYAG